MKKSNYVGTGQWLIVLTVFFGMVEVKGQDSLGVAYFPTQGVSLTFSDYTEDVGQGTIQFEDATLYPGDLTTTHFTGNYVTHFSKGDFGKFECSGADCELSFLNSPNICALISIPSGWNSTPVQVYVYDGNHSMVVGDAMTVNNGQVVLSGNVSVSVDASVGALIDGWINSPTTAVPSYVWDAKLVKGTYSQSFQSPNDEYSIQCTPSNESCVFIIQ